MITGFEYQKGNRFNRIYCKECFTDRLDEYFDEDWIFTIYDDEPCSCDFCGKPMGGNHEAVIAL